MSSESEPQDDAAGARVIVAVLAAIGQQKAKQSKGRRR